MFTRAPLASAVLLACLHPTLALAQDGAPSSGDDDAASAAADTSSATGRMIEEVIVTGTATGQSKFDTSYAISSLDQEAIQQLAPLNTADLLGRTPGVFAEASGGEASNVYRVRAIPNEGNFYAFFEDGMPLYGDSAGFFFTGDGILRTDIMTESFEVVRGGPAPVFADNAAAIFNQITRQGSDTPEGAVRATLGDTGLYRAEGYWSGPIADRTYLAAGGFYRYHDGYRDNGFPSDEGGQFRVNLRHAFDTAEVRAHVKYFDDSNVFYLPIPLADPRDPSRSLDPFIDSLEGTLNTPELQQATFRYADAAGNPISEQRDLSNGRQTTYVNTGFDIDWDVNERLRVETHWRYTDGDVDFDALYSTQNPADSDDFAAAYLEAAQLAFPGTESLEYRIAQTGEVYDPNLDSGLVVEAAYRSVQAPFESLMNDTRVSYDIQLLGEHTFTAGYFYAAYETDGSWRSQDYLLEVRGKPRLLDLVALDGDGNITGSVTDAGVLRYSSTLLSGVSDIERHAFFLSDTWQVTDQLTIDLGVRRTSYDGEGFFRAPTAQDLGDPTTLADNATLRFSGFDLPTELDESYTTWTVGGNYTVNDWLGVYARASSATRGPGEFNLILPLEGEVTETEQYELGVKVDTESLSVFATLFYSKFEPFSATLFALDPETGELGFDVFVGEVTSPGIEVDLGWRVSDAFNVNAAITYNDAQLGDFTGEAGTEPVSADGNMPIRQPKWYGNLRPSYYLPLTGGWDAELYAQYLYVGERFVDLENNTRLPAYDTLGAGFFLHKGPWTVQFYGDNLTNEVGVTEGNPRSDQLSGQGSSDAIYGRTIFGRNFRLVLTREF